MPRLIDCPIAMAADRNRAPWWQYLVLGGGHFALGAYADSIHGSGVYTSLGWPAIAWGVALLTFWGWSLWPSILIGSLALHFLHMEPAGWSASLFVVGEVGEILIGTWLIRRGLDWSKGFRTVRQLRRGAVVGMEASLFGATFGTLAFAIQDPVPWTFETGAGVFFHWWLRSVLGFWMVAPAIGSWFDPDRRYLGNLPREGLLVSFAVVALTFLTFSDALFSHATPPIWVGLLACIPLIWAGARCGIFLSSHLALVVLAGASFAATTHVSLETRLAVGELRAMWWLLLVVSVAMTITLAVLNQRNAHQSIRLGLARKRLELLVQDSPLALIEWDLEFRVRRWSRRATEMFGFTEDQAIGLRGPDFLVPAEHRTLVMERWAMVLGGQAGVRTTNPNLTASGQLLYCDWYGSPVHDELGKVVGVVSLVDNVTAQRQAELDLAASEQRFQSVAEVLPQLISYYDADLRLLYGNAAFLEIHGLNLESLPIPLDALVDATNLERILPLVSETLAGQPKRFLEKFAFLDDYEHDLDRVLLPDFDPEGVVRGFFSVCTDISEYRAAARERLALETQVLQTQKLESLGMLSGKIAHEFNNRLFGILGRADMAREDLDRAPTEAATHLTKVIEIAREASDLCRQLFVYSGHGSKGRSLMGVNPLVQEMRRLLELSLPRNVRLRTRLEEGLPEIQVDAAQMRQAIVNLVQNAAQSMGEDRGEVQLRTRLVSASDCRFQESFLRDSGAEDVDLIEIAVCDEGDGIAPEDLGRVFEPFFTRRPGARGLGLSGVLGIIHGHSGAITVVSEPGQGTEVRLYLPLCMETV